MNEVARRRLHLEGELRKADSAYDSGDFDGAITFYMTARAVAGDAGTKARAERGLHRSVLGLGLVRDAPRPDVADPRAQFAALREKAAVQASISAK